MRHDWNSLINENNDLLMTKYSKEFFPAADVMVRKNLSNSFNQNLIQCDNFSA